MNYKLPYKLDDGTLPDFALALAATGEKLSQAAENALELLKLAGYASTCGDTADDLRIALASHLHLVAEFHALAFAYPQPEKVARSMTLPAACHATNAGDAIKTPDMVALAAAHRALKVTMPLNQALNNPAIKVVLHAVATKARKRQPRIDFRKLAANDLD